MVFLTSSMDGLRLGSLSQQRVIRVSIGSGRSLISGGRVPENRKSEGPEWQDSKRTLRQVQSTWFFSSRHRRETTSHGHTGCLGPKHNPYWVSTVSTKLCEASLDH